MIISILVVPAHFSAISAGTVTGAALPTQFHDGDSLYFNGAFGVERSVHHTPLSLSNATISFRLRLGNGFGQFENIDGGEEVVLEGSKDNGATWTMMHEFRLSDPRFHSADVWDLAQIQVPSDLVSSATQFRLKQKTHSGPVWIIGPSTISIVGQPFELSVDRFRLASAIHTVSSVNVVFREPITATTFNYQDIKLTRDNVDIPLNSSVTVASIDTQSFRIDGLSPFTAAAGDYQLTVEGTGISKVTEEV